MFYPYPRLQRRYLSSNTAFSCDWHLIRKSLVSIIILGALGLLWSAIIHAFILKGIYGYDEAELNWYEACALGFILSALDPGAVVGRLKSLGASVKLTSLIDG